MRPARILAAAATLLAVAGVLPRALPTLRAQASPAPAAAPPVSTTLTLFAGSPAGLWRSDDWGGKWQLVTTGPIVEAGGVNGILPLGARVYVAAQRGLFLSDDFGQTWTISAYTRPAHFILPSRYAQADPTVFVGTADGLLRSDDAGRTFKPTGLTGTAVTRIEWPGPALVLATGNGVVVSMDAGRSFSGSSGLPAGPVGAITLSSFFAVDPVLFASVGHEGVFRSADGGRTWAPAGLTGHTVADLVWLGPLLYAVSEQGVFRSEDGGKAWTRIGEGLPAGAVPSRILFPLAPDSGAEAFLATDRGVFRTADGGARWMDAGLRGERVSLVATFPPPSTVTLDRKKRRRP